MKPSDEQVRGWAQESYEQWRAYGIGEAPRPALQREEYIAHKAYEFGRESMREEAVRACHDVADQYYNQCAGRNDAEFERHGLSKQASATTCAEAIRNLPTSEGDNG